MFHSGTFFILFIFIFCYSTGRFRTQTPESSPASFSNFICIGLLSCALNTLLKNPLLVSEVFLNSSLLFTRSFCFFCTLFLCTFCVFQNK